MPLDVLTKLIVVFPTHTTPGVANKRLEENLHLLLHFGGFLTRLISMAGRSLLFVGRPLPLGGHCRIALHHDM